MRQYLYSTDEVFVSTDGMAMQEGAALDTSAMLAAWCGNASDTGITSGCDPQAVLAGLNVTASVLSGTVTIAIAPGSLVYAVADAYGANWKIANSTTAGSVTTAVTAASYKKMVIVEAVVAEVTTNQTRTFRRSVSGRIVYEKQSTPKIKNAVVTFQARSGTTVPSVDSVYLPNWTTLVLPIAMIEVTDTTATVTDLRRIVNPGMKAAYKNPIRATTDMVLPSPTTAIEPCYVGFGNRTGMDFVKVESWGSTYPNPVGNYIVTESGYTQPANSVAYVYALRPTPKVGAVSLVVSPKTHDVYRNLTDTAIDLPAPWPVGTSVSGSEAIYLFPQYHGDFVRSSMEVFGTKHEIRNSRPSFTVTNKSPAATFTVQFDSGGIGTSMLPANTTTFEVDIKVTFTDPGVLPTGIDILVNDVVGTGDTAYYSLQASTGGFVPFTTVIRTRISLARNLGSQRATMTITPYGTSVDPFDVTLTLNEVNELLRQ